MIANAEPTKEFFVSMITKDITLEDCILDLIDNCLDGARRCIMASRPETTVASYTGYHCYLDVAGDRFRIADNCGGIDTQNARHYAFRFGRHADAPPDGGFSVGLYGIGMKRAVLKLGRDIRIDSATPDDSFKCRILVEEWLKHDDWHFGLTPGSDSAKVGTMIEISDLWPGIGAEFADGTFVSGLMRIIARDYVLFMEKGFRIIINGTPVKPRQYVAKMSADFKPYRKMYDDGDVRVEVLAGMAAFPPNSDEPMNRVGTEYYGWFVVCNDRVVLAADKSKRTVWDRDVLVQWHPQYNGFLGMVLFHARDPNQLPWNTTKRDVDESSTLYRRAVTEMKMATQPWVEYTSQRRAALVEMKKRERRDGIGFDLPGREESDVWRTGADKGSPDGKYIVPKTPF